MPHVSIRTRREGDPAPRRLAAPAHPVLTPTEAS